MTNPMAQAQPEPQNLRTLKEKLREIFQLDRGDLDFGIYRIMNVKRQEVETFLEAELLPQVKAALAKYQPADKAAIETDLNKVISSLRDAGVDPETSPKVNDLRAKLADSVDLSKIENEIYSDLYNFFKRYYSEGDFLSLRRYKEGVYALPYEGEEVKLHWANADQYYIKSTENLSSYAFRTTSNRRVRFEVVDANTEQNNNKAETGKERRFMLLPETPVVVENGETVIRFEYKPDAEGRKQDAITAETAKTLLADPKLGALAKELGSTSKVDGTAIDCSVLEKHLRNFTARNTFDYFIHKDLGGFLRREMDFYIKNEVMHLDDIESDTAARVEQYLSKIKVFRSIAGKIIQFLEQLENFQKKLWLKKKFVLETQYCITLDRIPESFYPEIAANDAQRQEWIRLFAIDEIKGDLTRPAYKKTLTVDFLKANPFLVLDTAFFSWEFKESILAAIDDIDECGTGTLINSDNFQALNLLQKKLQSAIKGIYIDPPYNTSASEILYKNSYKNSSWLSLMQDRLSISKILLQNDGVICVTIDDFEHHRLKLLLDQTFSQENLLGIAAIRSNPAGRSTAKRFSIAHEYGLFYANSDASEIGRLDRSEKQIARYGEKDEKGNFEWVNFRKHGGANANRSARPKLFYPIFVKENKIRFPAMAWNERKREWDLLEQPKSGETIVYPVNEKNEEKTWKWGSDTAKADLSELCAKPDRSGNVGVYCKSRLNEEGSLPLTWWDKKEYSATEHGTNLLTKLMGDSNKFSFPKSIHAVEESLKIFGSSDESIILDYFAGSGTTGHAVINLNREDGGSRKFFLVEMGKYFDEVTKIRVKKAAYCSQWKDGKPLSYDGTSQLIKYQRLESYEDALDNLTLSRNQKQDDLLAQNQAVREEYMLSYMLDVESKGSASLLNITQFADPFDYKLRITRNGKVRTVAVDLVETFNWLLGLRVQTMSRVRGVYVVTGENPQRDKVLVLWRNLAEIPNDKLEEWFTKQAYSTQDREFDVIYVNGDNNLENLKRPDETWKVRLIEAEFQRLMFDVKDV